MGYLSKMKFACEICSAQYSYDDHETHVKGPCSASIYPRCCEVRLTDETILKNHLENDCMKVQMTPIVT